MPSIFEIGGATVELTKAALDAAELRHLVLANNVANAGSVGFIPQRVTFEEHLPRFTGAQMATGSSMAIPQAQIDADIPAGTGIPAQVMLDFESAKIAQNVVHYQALVRGLGKRMDILALAISDGRR